MVQVYREIPKYNLKPFCIKLFEREIKLYGFVVGVGLRLGTVEL